MNEILIPILAVTIIGLICGVGLAVASHVMAVKEDERFPGHPRVPPRRKLRRMRLYRLRRLREGAAYPRYEDESLRSRWCGGSKEARGGARCGSGGCRAQGRNCPLRRRLRAHITQGRLPRHCLVSGGKAVFRRQGVRARTAASASATARRSVRMTRFTGTTALRLSTRPSASAAACAQRPARSR